MSLILVAADRPLAFAQAGEGGASSFPLEASPVQHLKGFPSSPFTGLGLQANAMGYLQNNEYFNDSADGYTLFGYWLDLRLRFAVSANTWMSVGAMIEDAFGADGLNRVSPALTLQHQSGPWKLTFGNLLTVDTRHGLTDPWVDFEKPVRDPVEQGLEIFRQDESTLLNVWLDWQQSTSPGMSQTEKFWLGARGEYSLGVSARERLDWVVRLSGFHEGGQNLISSPGALSIFNFSPGFRYFFGFAESSTYGLGLELFAHGSKSVGRVSRSGHGIELNAHLGDFLLEGQGGTRFTLVYFNSLGFESPMGGDLYQNFSSRSGSEGEPLPRKELVFFRIERREKLSEAFDLFFRIEPYMDLRSKQIEHAEALRFAFHW